MLRAATSRRRSSSLGATARSAGKGGERTEPLEDFLANGEGRLLLDVSYDEAERQTGYALGLAARTPTTTRSSPSRPRSGTASCASPRRAPARAPCCSIRTTRSPGSSCATTRSPRPGTASKLLPKLVERALANLEEA